MRLLAMVGVALGGALVFTAVAAAERPSPGTPLDDKVGVNVALQVGGGSYQFKGQGSCTHEPRGYIYGIAAKLWRVQQNEGQRFVMLTFWSPASGSGAMFSLHVTNGGKSYETNTVKGKDAPPTKGSGSVTFAPAESGGTFTVNATAADGAKISGTIKCDAFRPAIAEGGH